MFSSKFKLFLYIYFSESSQCNIKRQFVRSELSVIFFFGQADGHTYIISQLAAFGNIANAANTFWCLVPESKSTNLIFTIRRDPSPPAYWNNVKIPPATTVKCLGLHLDNKPNWKEHIVKKRKQMDLRHKEFYSVLGRSSPLSVGKKTFAVQISHYSCMDLWHWIMGLCLQAQYCNDTEMPV